MIRGLPPPGYFVSTRCSLGHRCDVGRGPPVDHGAFSVCSLADHPILIHMQIAPVRVAVFELKRDGA